MQTDNGDSGGIPSQDLSNELNFMRKDRVVSGELKVEEPRILESTPFAVDDIF